MTVMRPLIGPALSRAGFTLAELSALLAVLGALFGLSLPTLMSYYQSAHVRGAAADIAAYLNQARQIAIRRNQSTCVHITAEAVQYHLGTCGSGPLWVGPGTDSNGHLPAPAGITLASSADPVFTNLGAAVPAATVTVTHGRASLSVIVSASGRVTIGR